MERKAYQFRFAIGRNIERINAGSENSEELRLQSERYVNFYNDIATELGIPWIAIFREENGLLKLIEGNR